MTTNTCCVFVGINIVSEALKVPCYTIAENAGEEGSIVVNKVSYF